MENEKERDKALKQILDEFELDIRKNTAKELYHDIIDSFLITDRNRWRLKALLKCKYGVEIKE